MGRINVNGVMLNVMEIAPRPGRRKKPGETPIVMIHGLAASSAFWYAAGAPYLAAVGPVLLYDLRGHGKSETPESGYGVVTMTADLGALLDAMGIGRAHLVAHSFGGMIAVLYALRNPDRVASLIIADSRMRRIQSSLAIPLAKITPAIARRLSLLGIEADALSRTDDGIGYLNSVARIQIAAEAEADEIMRALYSHPQLFRSRRNAERWIRLTETVSLVSDLANEETFGPQELRQIGQPMLVLVGAKSSTLPSARALAQLCPRAILREIPGVGHFFPISSPALFLKPALRFLRAVEAGGDRLETVMMRRRALSD
jgi:pimeloyl-ACP methyl ester carboxylesterase